MTSASAAEAFQARSAMPGAEFSPEDTARAIRDALGVGLKPAALVAELQARSIAARLVTVTPDDVQKVALPFLLFERDGSSAWCTRVKRTALTLQMQGGRAYSVPLNEFERRFDSTAVEILPDDFAGTSLAHGLGKFLGANARLLYGFIALTVVVQIARLGVPVVIRVTTDIALPMGAKNLVTILALGVVLIAAQRAWLEWLRQALIRSIDARLTAALLRGVFARILRLPVSYLQRRSAGDLMQAMASAESIGGITVGQMAVPLSDALFAWSYLALIAINLPLFAALLGLAGIVLAATASLCGYNFGATQARVVKALSRQRSLLYEILEGASTLKISSAGKRSVSKWVGLLADYQSLVVKQLRLGLRLELVFEGGAQLVTISVLAWGGQRCLRGELSIGLLLSTLLLSKAFIYCVMTVSQAIMPLLGAHGDLKRVNELLRVEPARQRSVPLGENCEVVLDDVWFRYSPAHPWILEGYSLRVPKGQRHTLTGPSGTGKTTLLRLMAGFYKPERGRVTINGADATELECISYLPQQVQLVEGSIMDNLVLFSQASHEHILEAARATGLADLVASMPMKYDTRLPPGASTLSGGQRQLVAFTAAVAAKNPLVLLDEPFSNMDRLMQGRLSLANFFPGKTVISVEHQSHLIAEAEA